MCLHATLMVTIREFTFLLFSFSLIRYHSISFSLLFFGKLKSKSPDSYHNLFTIGQREPENGGYSSSPNL